MFLAPTKALVDQTAQAFQRSFPGFRVRCKHLDELGFMAGGNNNPEIFVMTPEACLAQMTFDAPVFDGTGLLVFDECHLLDPNDNADGRRAIDAMLCVLNFARLAPEADLLLLSAMMKNTKEIAGWLEDLTGRSCLALSLAWKPTRQLRGSIVYHVNDIEDLEKMLWTEKNTSTTKGVPTSVKRVTDAAPLGFFSLKQTWASKSAEDYALTPLLEEKVLLGVSASRNQWYLTPNAGEISSAIAAAASEAGMKTLVFFQSIKNAASAARKVTARLGEDSIKLTKNETAWVEAAVSELGGSEHLYIETG